MRNLGWKTNDELQEKFARKECTVIYSGIHTVQETNQSYIPRVYIKIIFDMDDNNDMFTINDQIIDYVTGYVKLESHASWSTTFIFEDTDFIPTGGTSYRVEMTASYYYERAWQTEF